MDFCFRKYEPQDREQVLRLMDNLWTFSPEEKEQYFRWKYEQNPYTSSPMGFVALDGERIVSFRGYMVQPLTYNHCSFLNASLADTVTDTKYRRMGLFSGITKYSINELSKDSDFKVSLNSSSGGATLNGYLKLGWLPLAARHHLFSFSGNSFRKNLPDRVYPIEIARKDADTILLTKEVKADQMAQLATRHTQSDLISLDRDVRYFRWRFANPTASYLFAYYYHNGMLEAYCCFKEIGKRKLDIIDYAYNARKQLRALLKAIRRTVAPRYILCWTVNPNDRIINSPLYFGFVNLQFLLRFCAKFRKPPFLIRLTRSVQSDQDWMLDDRDMRNASTWNLNKAIADEI